MRKTFHIRVSLNLYRTFPTVMLFTANNIYDYTKQPTPKCWRFAHAMDLFSYSLASEASEWDIYIFSKNYSMLSACYTYLKFWIMQSTSNPKKCPRMNCQSKIKYPLKVWWERFWTAVKYWLKHCHCRKCRSETRRCRLFQVILVIKSPFPTHITNPMVFQ